MLSNAKAHSDGESRIVYGEELLHKLERQDIIEKRLLECCENNEFELRFMPIFNAKTLQIDGAECLIRCPVLFDINACDAFTEAKGRSKISSKLSDFIINSTFMTS